MELGSVYGGEGFEFVEGVFFCEDLSVEGKGDGA